MKKHRLPYMVAGAVLFAALFTGCTNERLEDELDFRKIGINSMQSGDYEGAVAAFNSALSQCVGKITDTELDICYYKAAAQYAGGDIEGALATYQAMIDYDEENGNAYYLHGCLSLKQQDTDTAKKDFANAVKYNPDDYELYVGIYRSLPPYPKLDTTIQHQSADQRGNRRNGRLLSKDNRYLSRYTAGHLYRQGRFKTFGYSQRLVH